MVAFFERFYAQNEKLCECNKKPVKLTKDNLDTFPEGNGNVLRGGQAKKVLGYFPLSWLRRRELSSDHADAWHSHAPRFRNPSQTNVLRSHHESPGFWERLGLRFVSGTLVFFCGECLQMQKLQWGVCALPESGGWLCGLFGSALGTEFCT
jgi:hypothetical protein